MSKLFSWTPEQQQAISERNKNLLVSASAGSGKTTVMIERIIELMIGVNSEKTPITNFLIVTFTKASASDMKNKLVEKLLKLPVDDFVLEQIEDVDVADISDLHSFYSKLISTYFYELDIDPAYRIIDGEESANLKNKAISKLFEDREKNSDENYFKIYDIFQKKRNDNALKEIIFKFSDFLNSINDGEAWFQNKINEISVKNLNENACANLINYYVSKNAKEDAFECEKFAEYCVGLGAETIAEYFFEMADSIKTINLNNTFLVNAKNINDISFLRAKRIPKEFEFLKQDADKLKTKIKKNILNYKDNFISSDEKVLVDGIISVEDNLSVLFELTKEFNKIYAKLKKDANGLDFNDLEKYALKILQNDAICEAVKEKYKYIFVDEFQDINEVQEKIISMISSENNRFMVGDIKQSIYGFRHCDPEIFMAKAKDYSQGHGDSQLIKLNCNFRSDKKILKFVDEVFSGVMTENFGGVDYKNDSQFIAGDNNIDNANSVNLCYIDTTLAKLEKEEATGVYSVKNHNYDLEEDVKKIIAEANYVAGKISELTNPLNENPLKFSDIAILVQSRNEDTLRFLDVLRDYGIPVSSDEKYDLMSKNYIQEIMNFIEYICAFENDILLFKVLKSKLFNFNDNELVELRKLNMKGRFFDSIKYFDRLDNIDLKRKIKKFNDAVLKFRRLAGIRSIQDMARLIILEFELDNINLLCENGVKINEEIDKFISRLPNKTAYEFLINYPNFSMIFENECSGDAVNVMTIHKSKGIEFRAVFLINNSKLFNLRTIGETVVFNKKFGAGLDFYDTETRTKKNSLSISATRIYETRKLIEEEQRLLYVALTRAKEKLFVVCSKQKKSLNYDFVGRPNAFINWFERFIVSELEGRHNNLINFESFDIHELLNVVKKDEKQILLTSEQVDELKVKEYKYLNSINVPLKNSISKILYLKNNELDFDSFEEKWFDDDAISSADRGTIYHKFFQSINLKNLSNIQDEIENAKKFMSENELKIIDEKLVKNVLNHDIFMQICQDDIILQEREFCAKMPASLVDENVDVNDEFILQGVIDLLIIQKDGAILLDYKTGKCNDFKLKNYSFQLNSYAEVCERTFNVQIKKKVLCFIDLQKIIEI